MTPNEYQKLAERTECNQVKALARISAYEVSFNSNPASLIPIRLNHAALGLAGEVGELCAAVERHIYYGKDLDVTNVCEELGDALWYIAEACNALDLNLEDVMAKNIAKLRQRYPERYTDDAAANRDLAAERAVLEHTGNGWSEPPEESFEDAE